MPKIKYAEVSLRASSLATVTRANQIVAEYAAQGFDLTLRQLYYQFVSRGWIPNNQREYKKLGDAVSTGRMAGLIDWSAIVDRTRNVRTNSHWDSPTDIIKACARQFQIDKWRNQEAYCECWIEKDALVGVIENVCRTNDVPFYACRGYSSASEVWEAGRNRFMQKVEGGKKCTILYLGDHDPSGIDMTRDVRERINLFAETNDISVVRLALNMDQIEHYNPPPNPAKMTDSRSGAYVEAHGDQSWELDALEPGVIVALINDAIDQRRDPCLWAEAVEEEETHKKNLKLVADHWEEALECLSSLE